MPFSHASGEGIGVLLKDRDFSGSISLNWLPPAPRDLGSRFFPVSCL